MQEVNAKEMISASILSPSLFQTEHMIAKLEEVPGVRRFVSWSMFTCLLCVRTASVRWPHLHVYFPSHCQGVPVHKSYVVLFKYYGGGEVDYFEVASSLQVQGSVAEPTSAGGLLYMVYILVIPVMYEYIY